MIVPWAPGAKLVAGKIAEQVAIQAAAELLLRRLLPGRRGSEAPQDNPIADLELQALMSAITAPGGLIEANNGVKPKPKLSKFNKLVKKHMREEKKKHPKSDPKVRFKKATKAASKELHASRNKKRRK